MARLLFILSLIALFAHDASAGTRAAWPKKDFQKRSLTRAGFSPEKFQKFVDFAFQKRLTFTTDSIVVIKDGYLVYEKHTNDYKRDQKHAIWSLGKTILNALVGVLEQQGRLNRHDLLRKYYPAIDQAGAKNITISQILWMSSGIQWIEEDKENLLHSDSWDAFYSKASYMDMAGYVAKRPLIYPEGTKFNYSVGDGALLAAAVRGAVPANEYMRFPWVQLFDKLGMKNMAIERDGSGYLALQGLGYASPLDLARFGLLYLRNGNVNGEQILPNDWVYFTSQMAPSQLNPPVEGDRNLQNNQAYGAQIWLNVKRPVDKKLPYPELPENAMIATGTRGQVILLLPEQDLILVRTATDTNPFVHKRKQYRQILFKHLFSSLEGK